MALPLSPEAQALAKRIDETLLGDTTADAIIALCKNALQYDFRAVCVRPEWVKLAKTTLKESTVMVATVIGFPQEKQPLEAEQNNPTFGNASIDDKVAEITQAKADGADELDIVMNLAEFKAGFRAGRIDPPSQYEAIQLVRAAGKTPVKLIIETDLLWDEEIAKATLMAVVSGVDCVKTSTGYLIGGQGATDSSIRLIYNTIQEAHSSTKPSIKASGGIRDIEKALKLIHSGADIIGSSNGAALVEALNSNRSSEAAQV